MKDIRKDKMRIEKQEEQRPKNQREGKKLNFVPSEYFIGVLCHALKINN